MAAATAPGPLPPTCQACQSCRLLLPHVAHVSHGKHVAPAHDLQGSRRARRRCGWAGTNGLGAGARALQQPRLAWTRTRPRRTCSVGSTATDPSAASWSAPSEAANAAVAGRTPTHLNTRSPSRVRPEAVVSVAGVGRPSPRPPQSLQVPRWLGGWVGNAHAEPSDGRHLLCQVTGSDAAHPLPCPSPT